MSSPQPLEFTITNIVSKTIENATLKVVKDLVVQLGSEYNFDSDAAISKFVGDGSVVMVRKSMHRGEKTKKAVVAKSSKKSLMPIPFIKSCVNPILCSGLAYNRGLFTQCINEKSDGDSFCFSCQTQADLSVNSLPLCGTVTMRCASELYEFTDSSGRKPVAYSKILSKLGVSVEAASTEASNLGIDISEHLSYVAPSKPSSRGRPKKGATIAVADGGDLFSELIEHDTSDSTSRHISWSEEEIVTAAVVDSLVSDNVDAAAAKAEKDLGVTLVVAVDAAKAEKESAKVAAAIAKAEKEATAVAAKAEKESAKVAAATAKAEKEATAVAAKAEKEATAAAAKAEKEATAVAAKAEKEATTAAAKAEKESAKVDAVAAKAAKESAKAEQNVISKAGLKVNQLKDALMEFKDATDAEKQVSDEVSVNEQVATEVEQTPKAVKVRRETICGVVYLVDPTDCSVYSVDEHTLIGTLAKPLGSENNTINMCDEEEEEEYDDESDEEA
jgi:flagellar biosynthesis GTPase FlhF